MAQVYRCAFNTDTVDGVRIVNTFHIAARPQTLNTQEESAAAVRDVLATALITKYRALIPADATVQSLVVREELAPGDESVPDEAAETIGLAGTGVATGDRLPWGCCMLVTFYTNAAVRSGHGRMFVAPGFPAAYLSSAKTWDQSGALWTAVATFMDELKAGHSTGSLDTGHDLNQVVYSRTRRAGALPEYFFDVQSYVRRITPHWLKSRMTSP